MKLFALLLFLVLTLNIFAQVKVRGYHRSNGTYVQPHYRSNPDGNPYNNWSFPGNTNPYTGKVATGNPSTYLKNYSNNNERTTTNQSQYTSGSSSVYLPYSNNESSSTSQTNYSNGSDIIDLLREHISNIKNYSVNVSSLNLRGGPSTSYPVIRSLSYNENVTVIESYTNGWKKVEYKTYSNLGYSSSIIGFVAGNYISNSNLGVNDFSAISYSNVYDVFNTSTNATKKSAPVESIKSEKSKDYNTIYTQNINSKQENYKFESGDIYWGDFIDGKMSGYGRYDWKNGDKYVGEFKNNDLNGYGKLTNKNGEIFDGYFKNGELNGEGSITLINGLRLVGLFKNGLLNGYGSKIYANEIREKGYYVDGILSSRSNTTTNNTPVSTYGNASQNYTEKVNTPIYNTEPEVSKNRDNTKIFDTETKIIAKPKSNEMVNYYGRYLFWTTFYSSYSYIPLREKIDLNAKIIYDCPQNCKVYVIEDLGNLQYKVFVNGYTGYISSNFLKPISK
jgi:hypothetical protein